MRHFIVVTVASLTVQAVLGNLRMHKGSDLGPVTRAVLTFIPMLLAFWFRLTSNEARGWGGLRTATHCWNVNVVASCAAWHQLHVVADRVNKSGAFGRQWGSSCAPAPAWVFVLLYFA